MLDSTGVTPYQSTILPSQRVAVARMSKKDESKLNTIPPNNRYRVIIATMVNISFIIAFTPFFDIGIIG